MRAGAGGRIRTVDLPLTRRLLCQLSYAGRGKKSNAERGARPPAGRAGAACAHAAPRYAPARRGALTLLKRSTQLIGRSSTSAMWNLASIALGSSAPQYWLS